MKAIRGRNINEVFAIGVPFLQTHGLPQKSQHGDTLEIPEPVGVMYENPCERVLFDEVRDNNPFLGFFEALWILAGRDDVKFLADIVGTMAKYSDNGTRFYGAYGHRLRKDSGDQISAAIRRLINNHDDRQVVCLIRHPVDMNYHGKDQPCNYAVDFKVRNGRLNMTVLNRSNDFVWGMCGTNVVQFSTLQEYVASMIGVDVGHYHQITTSMHCYKNEQWDKLSNRRGFTTDPYESGEVNPYPMFKDSHQAPWHLDLEHFFDAYDVGFVPLSCNTPYFHDVVYPMWETLKLWKRYQTERSPATASAMMAASCSILASDWRMAVQEWLERRVPK